jgi:hypothetical protein
VYKQFGFHMKTLPQEMTVSQRCEFLLHKIWRK